MLLTLLISWVGQSLVGRSCPATLVGPGPCGHLLWTWPKKENYSGEQYNQSEVRENAANQNVAVQPMKL
jgi:hypothetical protein